MKKTFYLTSLIAIIFLLTTDDLLSQGTMPEVLTNGTLDEQMTYVHERTRIYENYRAIREDIFQMIRKNSIDSLVNAKADIKTLTNSKIELESEITNLNNQIATLNTSIDEAVKNRDSLMLFGMRMSKSAYNKLLWTIIIALIALTLIVFLMFRRGHAVTRMAKTDLEDIKVEFEDFRKVAHENKEKLIVSHFNEIKKLKEMRM